MNTKIYIVIPAYNEERQIGKTITNLKRAGYENILVVNDGSKDATAKVARATGVEVLDHILNRGQGAALRTGLEYLREEKLPEIIITFDADGQHSPQDIPQLIAPIIADKADIVLGSRFLHSNCKIPPMRKAILKAGILFTNIISEIKLTDTHNGLRALGKKAIETINIHHRGMEHASDIIDEIAAKKLRYQEVPVEILYTKYSLMKGQKTSNFIQMGINIIIKKILN